MMQALTCPHQAEERALVIAGGWAQGDPPGTTRLAAQRPCRLGPPGGPGLVLVRHKTPRYRELPGAAGPLPADLYLTLSAGNRRNRSRPHPARSVERDDRRPPLN